MLARNSNVQPQEEFYADSLLTKPTLTQSVFDNLAAGIATPVVAINALDGQLAQKPEGQAILSSLDAIRLENETPGIGWGQWLANEGAGMIGMALNPITWGLGEAGAVAAKGIPAVAGRVAPEAASVFMRKPIGELLSAPLGKYIPREIGKEGEEKTLSLALLSDKTLGTFGTFAGAGLPQGIVDNFNRDTGHIAWGGVAREMGEMGAFGIAIGSIPFTYGVLRGKINRGLGKDAGEPVSTEALSEALAKGHITPDEHAWYSDYLKYQADPSNEALGEELRQRGSNIINQNGHTANTVTNEAMFEILTPNDVTHLQGMIADQISGNVPEQYKTALSDFIVHNRMDYIRQNPKWLDGVRGYVDHINQKLEMKNPKLAEADAILDEHMMRGVKENMPFSQKELFKMMKQSGFEASHVAHIPVTIPENMAKIMRVEEKISKLKEKLKVAKRRGQPENKQTLRRIDELEASKPKILTPKEELTHIRKALLDGGLKKDFERSKEYHRLLDLSNVWHNARTLLNRVHLEHEYKRQEAFRDLAHQTLRISDSDAGRIAKPENVLDYLKSRVEGAMRKVEPIKDVEKAVKDKTDVPADSDAILTEQAEQIKKSDAEEAKKEFTESTDRLKEFKESENIFSSLIKCLIGSANA
jgi:hypothetical protein